MKMPASILVIFSFFVILALSSNVALAEDLDKKVVRIANNAAAHLKAVGKEKAYQDFSDKNGEWYDGGIYVVVLDIDGYSRFNPNNPRLTGKNFTNFADSNGKLWVKEMNERLRKAPTTWVEYNWPHPKTAKVRLKRAYAKMINDKDYVLIGYWP